MFYPGTQSLPPQVVQSEWRIPPSPPRREVILETVGLTKAYGKWVAVNGLNLEVLRGEVFGFLGPNGAVRQPPFVCCSISSRRPVASELLIGMLKRN